MNTEEIKQLSVKELEVKISGARSELTSLRLRKHTGQVDKPHRIKALRRGIARMLTFLTNKQSEKTAAQ